MKKVIILDIRNEESLSIFNDIDGKLKYEVSFLQNNIILTPKQYSKVLEKLEEIIKVISSHNTYGPGELACTEINETNLQLVADALVKGARAPL